MSLVLRHRPDKIGLVLDDHGWADLDELIERSEGRLNHDLVRRAVADNDKQRFAVSEDGKRIRARQGHSIEVDLDLEPVEPPEFLYHGTYPEAVAAIQAEGVQKMKRHHVHLSPDTGTAKTVGARRGRPVVFLVHAGRMHLDGHSFFVTDNGVWLTDRVPSEYLGVVSDHEEAVDR